MVLPQIGDTAAETAQAVRSGGLKAADVTEVALARVSASNPTINAFTNVTADRARAEAAAVDAAVAAGHDPGPLAGVPYAVKNLFDLCGEVTRTGSKINRDNAPATEDADLVQQMHRAGAVCLGALNMGEFAYDFTGENAHDGDCRNPHDVTRMTGGSSSGSGAATAARLAPITLGTDTNGSLRVPASLCGVFSIRPTYGRLSRGGSFPFVDALDTVGPLARTVEDLALAYDALQGPTRRDHACRNFPPSVVSTLLTDGIAGLRIGVLRGWFEDNCGDTALERRDRIVAALSADVQITDIDLDQAALGRAAAYLITHAESAAFHLPTLRTRAHDYDPDTRDRFLAGAMIPSVWIQKAQRVRRWWLGEVLKAFHDVDILIAPATPFSAPKLGQKTLMIKGQERPLRPFLGLLAQPFSCVGLPVLTAPCFNEGEEPIGLQLVAAPWREATGFQLAAHLERLGVSQSHRPVHS